MRETEDVRVLVVDDDAGIALLVRRALEDDGFHVDVVRNGADGERQVLEQDYSLVLLDVEMPGKSGIEVLRSLRQANRPSLVLMLTVHHGESDVVAGLDAGADDYLGKPFSMAELKARVRALLRRRVAQTGDTLEFGGIRMDRSERRVHVGEAELQLTPREFELLEYLLRRPNRVATRDELLGRVWGMDFDPGTNVIDVHVSHLRRKLNRAYPEARIRTERGVGFALTAV